MQLRQTVSMHVVGGEEFVVSRMRANTFQGQIPDAEAHERPR